MNSCLREGEEQFADKAEQLAIDDTMLHAQAEQETADVEEDLHDFSVHALSKTTSLYDDWLHRGPYLYDMDVHNYERFIQRGNAKNCKRRSCHR